MRTSARDASLLLLFRVSHLLVTCTMAAQLRHRYNVAHVVVCAAGLVCVS